MATAPYKSVLGSVFICQLGTGRIFHRPCPCWANLRAIRLWRAERLWRTYSDISKGPWTPRNKYKVSGTICNKGLEWYRLRQRWRPSAWRTGLSIKYFWELIIWISKVKPATARSNAKGEFYILFYTVGELPWTRSISSQFGPEGKTKSAIMQDDLRTIG